MSSAASEISAKAAVVKLYSGNRSNNVLSETQMIFDISAAVNPSSIKFCSNGFGISNLGAPFPATFYGQ